MIPGVRVRRPYLLMAYLAAGLLAIAVQASTLRFIGPLLLNGQLVDADSYTWLGHVQRLLATGAWYDHVQPRANWPYGEIQHSTRPLDALLLAATLALTPLLGSGSALFWAGAAMSPLLYLCVCATVAWTAATLFGRWRGPVAIVVLLAQFAALAYSLPGRADHHTLIMLVFVLTLGVTARTLRDPPVRAVAMLAGGMAGLGVWLSPEFLLTLAACFAALTISWVRTGDGNRSASALLFAAGLCVSTGVALALEYPPAQMLAPHVERISSADFAIGLLAVAFWTVVRRAEARRATPFDLRERLIVIAIGAGVALGGFALLFPGFLAGPLAGMDERARIILVDTIAETGGLLPTDGPGLGRFLLYLGFAAVALPTAGVLLWRERHGAQLPQWALLTLTLVIYIGSALVMLRFSPYAEIVGALVLSDALVRLLGASTLPEHTAGLRAAAGGGVAAAVVALAGGIGMTAYVAGNSLQSLPPCHQPLPGLARFINSVSASEDHPWTILAMTDMGPELLYRTRHRVIATPSLSNPDGAIAFFTIFSASDDGLAGRIIGERGIDHLLLCQALPGAPPESSDARLYARLLRGEPPRWLDTLPLPDDLESVYSLYRVRPENLPGASRRDQAGD